MARIAGVDLPHRKRIVVGLTYIYGVGRSTAEEILAKAGIDFDVRTDDLTEGEIVKLAENSFTGSFLPMADQIQHLAEIAEVAGGR